VKTRLLSNRLLNMLAEAGCNLMAIEVLELLSSSNLPHTQLTIRTYNALRRGGIHTLGELANQTPDDLMSIHNFGIASYREVVERLQAYLQPWLERLGVDPTADDWQAESQVPPEEADEQVHEAPESPVPYSDAACRRLSSRLLDLLDSCEIAWRQLSVLEICPDLKWAKISASLNDLTLGELIASEQANFAAPTIPLESANQLTDIIEQALINILVTHLLQTAASAQEEALQALAHLTVEALFAELIDYYINSLPESTGARKKALPREMKVLLARSGVLDGQPRTLEEIAALLDLTRERIRQLEKRAEDFLQGMSLRRFTGGLAALARWAIQAEGGMTTGAQAEQRISIWLPFGSLYPEMTTRLLIRWADEVTLLNGDWLLISPLNLRLGRIGGAWDSFFRCRCLNTAA
jgi:hypothetical protein